MLKKVKQEKKNKLAIFRSTLLYNNSNTKGIVLTILESDVSKKENNIVMSLKINIFSS
jgi:hypothetical protein